jgi:muramoyltetrapeptide carboxypeptidase
VAAQGINLISPSGAVPDEARLRQACGHLASLGFEVRLDRSALARDKRFAGTDRARAGAFARAAAQRAPVIMITRGGYGISRLLGMLDYPALAAAGKQWVGFSDFTAFQLAMLARAGAVTWAGPALLDDFGQAPDETTAGTLVDALAGRIELLGFDASGPSGVEVQGTLWGGNLSMLCSLVGTPYLPDVIGGILFLEDVGEHPYRLERLLTQLLHAGILARQQAILLGTFNRYRLAEHDHGFDFPDVLRWLRRQVDVPVFTGLPFGHGQPKLSLPHGATVGFASTRGKGWLVLPGHDHEHTD